MGWAWDSQTHTRLVDSLICITCSLENNAFSVLHYVMVASHYSMLHWLEIFSTPGTIAQIVLTKYIQCWAAVLCNNHSNYRSIEKRPCEISCKEQWLLLYRNTLQHWRECLPPVEFYKTVFRLNGLDLNGYFEDCKSENTRANHPYKVQTKSAKVNSLKYSFFVKIIKDWNNLPDHLFTDEIRLSNFLSTQNGDIFQSPTNHRSAD